VDGTERTGSAAGDGKVHALERWRWLREAETVFRFAAPVSAMVIVRVAGRPEGVWFIVWLVLMAISMAAMLSGEVVARRRRRAGWVPVRSGPDVAGFRTLGKWRRPDDPV
jgi:hypothetical protein